MLLRGSPVRGAHQEQGGAMSEQQLDERVQARNEVVLVGRVSARAEERELPSGDVIATWRVVVDRPPGRRRSAGAREQKVDTLDCVAWSAGLRRTARGLAAGDVVSVEGALRRRFWRGGAGATSRCEIEVSRVRRVVAQTSR
jgi:single-strand DNA-binding protein